jgi:uncharacterized protein
LKFEIFMRILVIGATGFIGKELVKELASAGHQPEAVSRDASKARDIFGNACEIVEWDGLSPEILAEYIAHSEAIVNLAGANIGSRPWTRRRKKLLLDSRVSTGHLLTEAIRLSKSKPEVLVQASAIGYYGTPVEKPAGEDQPSGCGFLAGMAHEWESSVRGTVNFVNRIVIIRTGLVLGRNEGLMKKLLVPFHFYCGTVLGTGRQWMSWIHIRDEVRSIRFLLENKSCAGPFNLTAPDPVSMKFFIMSIGKIMDKPAWLRLPGIFLETVLGEMARETVLASQNIYPAKLLKEGFEFEYSNLSFALADLLTRK